MGKRTYNNYLFGYHGLLNALINREIISKNPSPGLPKLPIHIGKNVAFSLEQRETQKKHLWALYGSAVDRRVFNELKTHTEMITSL